MRARLAMLTAAILRSGMNAGRVGMTYKSKGCQSETHPHRPNMRMTMADVVAHESRIAKRRPELAVAIAPKSDREWPLHAKIIEYCNAQSPRWRYRHMRYNVPSTEDIAGAEDFSIFLPGNRALHIEVKKSDGKLDKDQVVWKFEMERLGHEVVIVRSFDEFLNAVNAAKQG